MERCYGMADLEQSVPITSRSIFDIASTSKQFTAACILLLARERRLTLDDDVRKFIPQLPEYKRTITVRHLVHHASGLRDYINMTLLAGRSLSNDYSEDEVIDLLARQRNLEFSTGSRYGYSNSGYLLLSEIVRSVTRSSLRAFAEENIFGPLGMSRTFFHDDFTEIVPERAVGYGQRPEGSGADGYRIHMPLWDVVGDGALFTNVEDLAKWDRQFYDCSLPGGDEFMQQMVTPGQFDEGKRVKRSYAFGLSIGEYRGARTVSHGGAWGGYRAEVLRFPDHRTTFIVLANLSTIAASQLAYRVAEVLLQEELQPAESEDEHEASEVSSLEEWCGFYRDRKGTIVAEIARDESAFVVNAFGGKYRLEPSSTGVMKLQGVPARIRLVGPGSIRMEVGIQDRWTLDRVAAPIPSTLELIDYTGLYYSRELDATYTVDLDGDSIRLRRAWMPWEPVTAAGGDLFKAGSSVLQFKRSKGRVSGFTLGMPRVGNIRFSRSRKTRSS